MTAPRRTALGWLLGADTDPAGLAAAEEAARADGALDLRVVPADPGPWEAAGFAPLHPGSRELVRPLAVALPDPAATRALGERLAGVVRAGDLLVLSGPLGAGKTTLTAGLGAALGVRGAVTSPTFVLARVHRGPLPLVHVDAYRLRDAAAEGSALDLDDLDLDAALEDAVTVVEWGEGLVERLAESHLAVLLDRPAGTETASHLSDTGDPAHRLVRVRAYGPRWATPGADDITAVS